MLKVYRISQNLRSHLIFKYMASESDYGQSSARQHIQEEELAFAHGSGGFAKKITETTEKIEMKKDSKRWLDELETKKMRDSCYNRNHGIDIRKFT